VDRCVLPLLWIPGPRHYLLFSHVSKSWIIMSCHSCGFQDLVITCYLTTLVNRGSVCPATLVDSRTIVVMGSFSVCSFLSCQQCHEFLLYVLVMTIEVVNCFSAYGPSQVCSFYLVATIQGLFFIHIATIVCQLFLIVFWTFCFIRLGS